MSINNKATILFAEDDSSLAFLVKDALEEEGFKVVHCSDGQTAIDIFDKKKFDLCLLDIMMPNKDGYMVAKKIRQQSDVMPVLFLTTKSHEEDRLKGYDTGADDYIAKPFSMPELLRKIDVFLRRSRKVENKTNDDIVIGQTVFSPGALKITTPNETFNITRKEADILEFMYQHKNHILQRQDILLHVWGKNDYFLGRSMDVFISKLRKYLKDEVALQLETIHGVGFRLVIRE
jgi:DNA-binding response OmpR family regulator